MSTPRATAALRPSSRGALAGRTSPEGLSAPPRSALRAQVQAASARTIGGHNVLRAVRERAATSPLPRPLAFGLGILSQEGRIADPTAFADGWVRRSGGNEKSPWQIDPDFHPFAARRPVENFRAYTDYAYKLLEEGFRRTGTLFGAARRYNSFNACETGRKAACERGRAYAREVIERTNRIEQILGTLGLLAPEVGTFDVPGGRAPDPGVSAAREADASLSPYLVGGVAAGVILSAYLAANTFT